MPGSVCVTGVHYNAPMKKPLLPVTSRVLAARRTHINQAIQQLPPLGARPLTIEGRVAGWVTSRVIEHIGHLDGVSVDDEAVHVVPDTANHRSLQEVIDMLAHTLKEAGCLRGWRNEQLDVIGEGRVLGTIERAAMRPLGLLTTAVHLNAWSADGGIWVAKRSDTKTTDPSMWDTLVGGLVSAGEAADVSLLRESQEEAGLDPADLHERTAIRTIVRMHRKVPEGYQVENILVSDCVLADDVVQANQDGEVSQIENIDLSTLWQWLEDGKFTHEAELVILDSLQNRLMDAPAGSV